MHGAGAFCIYVGVIMAALGVFGYVTEKRKHGDAGARDFLIWYAIAIPFTACASTGMLYPKPHWLYYIAGAIAVVSTLVQFRRGLRARAKARGESPTWWR